MKFVTIILLLMLLTGSFSSRAQNTPLTFERVSVEQGLTSNRINAIAQDQSGFIWIATNNGLNRFDGFENKQYTHQQSDSCSISSNSILAVFCDSTDQLWILTINYLNRYNKKLDNFDRFLLSEKRESYRLDNKGMITSDKTGNIWIGTPTNGLFFFNKQANRVEKVLAQIHSVSSLYCDKAGTIWIGSENGVLIHYDPAEKSFIQYRIPESMSRSVNDNFIWQIWEDDFGKLNLLLSSGITEFKSQSKTFNQSENWNKNVNYTNNELRSVFHDKQTIWVGTQDGGLYILDLANGKVAHNQTISNNPGSLSNNSITAILKDRSGVYWVATKDGLNKYDPTMKLFPRYQNEPGNYNSLHYNFVSSFCESPDGKIWIGTFGKGISVFDRNKEIFEAITHLPGKPETLVNDAVRALTPDHNGNIWIGTVDGLSCYNPRMKKFQHFRSSKEKGDLISDDILSLLVSSDNRLWIGTSGDGLSMYDLNTQSPAGFKNYNEITGLSTSRIRKITELSDGTISLGTLGQGISFLNKDQIRNVTPSNLSKNLDSDYINAICEDFQKNVWVGTWDGLFLLGPGLNILKQFNTFNGLPSGEISGILTDSKGDIWVSSMNGLSHLSKVQGVAYKITNYSTHNGLQGSYFTAYSTLKTKNGELYFGGYNGFNRFFPENITSNKEAPNVILTDFQVFNQSVPINKEVNGRVLLKDNISDTKILTLNYRHRIIGFRFAALATSQVEKVKYACLMKGVDPDWVYLDYNRRFISYNNLSPGEYNFTVKACNADGIWNNDGTSIKVIVLPPFWKTWWAIVIYTLIIIVLLYLTREYSLSRANLENKALVERIKREKDSEINNLKIKFFINISHEIRTPLSLIIAPLEKLVKSTESSPQVRKHLEMMYGNAQRLLNLINQLLDFRKIETGNVHLNVSHYDIVAVINEIKQAFEENAARKNIEFSIASNVEKLNIWFDPDSFEKILFNLLSNAFKFTRQNGSITIIINHLTGENKCEIIVRDNGMGVPGDKLEKLFDRFYQVETKSFLKHETVGSGIGLSIVKNLVELHKGEISVESVPEEFTLFRMVFLTGKKHLEHNNNITISDDPLPFSLNFHASIQGIDVTDSPEPAITQTSKNNNRILIVEDNPEIRYYLKQSLHSNYETIEAADGKIGYKLALQHLPDLIITDVMMPEMDGIELCKMLKSEMLTQHIPIIILSAKSTIEDTLEGLETGADDYVPKPFNEQILLAKVKTLMTNRLKLIEKYQNLQFKQSKEEDPDPLNFDDPFITRVVEFVKANLSDDELTNEKIESHFKTNKMQLYRKLKQVTGWSMNTLIREIRIREATQLLKSSEMNISEIAYKLGFTDPLYFSKYFKKEVGVAPQQYRKDHQ